MKSEPLENITDSIHFNMTTCDGSIFLFNSKAMMIGLLLGLIALRDKGETGLTVDVVRTFLEVENYIALATRTDLPLPVSHAMQGYLKSMGWKPDEPSDKWSDFYRQHEFAKNTCLKALAAFEKRRS